MLFALWMPYVDDTQRNGCYFGSIASVLVFGNKYFPVENHVM
jgi:hypothetical protein